MQASTKERLTGALLLVLALVILVPELLSGSRKPVRGTPPAQNPAEGAPVHTYDMVLDPDAASGSGPRDAPAPQVAAELAAVPPPVTGPAVPDGAPIGEAVATIDLAPAKPDGAKAVEAPQASEPAKSIQPAKAMETPKPVVAAKPEASPAKKPATGNWWTQLGSFASRDNAERLARQLRTAGYSIDVSQIRTNGKELYRVRAGPVQDRTAAAALQARLASAGHKSTVVAP